MMIERNKVDRIAKYDKVSYDQFKKDWLNTFDLPGDSDLRDENVIKDTYDSIKLPVRATSGSAGYDFFSPVDFVLDPGDDIKIPTGVKCWIDEGWVLLIMPRSGLGFKYYSRLSNTCGVIDCDYFYAENEGHMFIKLRNEGTKRMEIKKGEAISQGLFVNFGITQDDDVKSKRTGGFGSTTKGGV